MFHLEIQLMVDFYLLHIFGKSFLSISEPYFV